MNIIKIFLEFLIVFSIFACLTVITSTNPIIAIIYLIGVFLSAAIYLIFIGLNFIGISYIIVYIGAITVLFLFVIMMINVDILDIVEVGPDYTKILPLAFSISILFISLFIFLIPFFFSQSTSVSSGFNYINLISILGLNSIFFGSDTSSQLLNFGGLDYSLIGHGADQLEVSLNSLNMITPESSLISTLQISILGESLYSNFSLPLILSSIILLLALVTPIILSRNNSNHN
jgi:NADH-ubiquinone oxidoreductase chain 6